MLSAAFALVLSQTPIADKPTLVIHPGVGLKTSANCPMNGAIAASNPAIARPDIAAGPRGGFPDMVHMPPTVLMATLNRTINGCFTPLILASDVTASPPKPAPSNPGVR
jgi:hypothetical protein